MEYSLENNKKNEQLLSIILASFNSKKTIKKTIESVLNQTNSNFEFIIIDGYSSDNTVKIIKSYEINFENKKILYKWISEPDNGIYDAWNKGIKLSNGQWISFIGADDILIKDYITTYSKFIQKNGDLEYISSIVQVINNNKKIRVIDEGWNWDRFKRYMNVGHVGSLHNKKLFSRLGLYNEQLKIVGDYELLLRAKNTLKAGFINKTTILMGANGISNTSLFSVLNETKQIKIKYNTVSRFYAELDFIIAYLKGVLRKLIK